MNRIIFSRLNLALMAAIVCVTIAGLWLVPADQRLPLHWNRHDVVDIWGRVSARCSGFRFSRSR